MSDTSLSPRLRHLLIQEDKQTGRLIMPAASSHNSLRSSFSDGPYASPGQMSSSLPNGNGVVNNHIRLSPSSRNTSPAVSPTTFAFAPSPYEAHRSLPHLGSEGATNLLPPPTNRPTSSIFALLNNTRRAASPPSTASSSGSQRMDQDRERERRKATPPYISPYSKPREGSLHYQPPLSAPITSQSQSMYFDDHPAYPTHPQPPSSSQGQTDGRPGLLRRHSSHPYEYSPSRPATAYATGPVYEADYAAMGARAPISRTTKACNACRSRKVRCDAGGNGNEMVPCSRCRESGVQCVYTGVQKKRGPCPGTARPSMSKPRRPSSQSQTAVSHRSSVASVASVSSVQSYIVTPTDEQPWSTRSSYGFPPPPPHHSGAHVAAMPGRATSFSGPADPSEWSSIAPGKSRPATGIPISARGSISGSHAGPGANGTAVLSWPTMEPALEVVNRGMFDHDYAVGLRPKSREREAIERSRSGESPGVGSRGGNMPRSLPPLRVAINREAYHDHHV